MTETLERPDLAALTDDQLAALFGGEHDAAVLAECERRDQAKRSHTAHASRHNRRMREGGWYDAAHAQYLQAEAECAGVLVNDKGRNRTDRYGRPDPVDPWSLWNGSQWAVDAYASFELVRFWERNPRITRAEWKRQEANGMRWHDNDLDAARGRRNVTNYADIERQPTIFLELSEPVLSGRFPRGEVTILAGEGGAGKGQIGVWLAVDTALAGQHVVLVTPEDNLQATVRPRLEATIRALAPDRADDPAFVRDTLRRIHDLTFTESGAPFALSADGKTEGSIGQLRELVDDVAARLVVIDPLLACLAAGSISTNRGARQVMAPLQRLAAETGCALVLTHHTVKAGSVAGSKGLTDTARLVYRAGRDRENPQIRVLSLDKSNILPDLDAVRYMISGDGADTHVTWLNREELTARRTAWREEEDPGPHAAVQAALHGELIQRGTASHVDLAAAVGIRDSLAEVLLSGLARQGLVKRDPADILVWHAVDGAA